jgi:hypothetical protein
MFAAAQVYTVSMCAATGEFCTQVKPLRHELSAARARWGPAAAADASQRAASGPSRF